MLQNFKQSQKGAALITVLIAVMMLSLMIFEFQYSATVERQLAYNGLNQMKSYYLAKSGMNIGMLRVTLYARLISDPSIQKKFKGFPVQTYLDKIWNLPLPPFPPSVDEVKSMELKKDRDANEETVKTTMVDEGKTSHIITSESSKINLNMLVLSSEAERQSFSPRTPQNPTVANLNGHLLYNLIEGIYESTENAFEVYGDTSIEQIVYNIADWVSPGDERLLGGNKDAAYQKREPPYRAKRNRFYTVEELKMVEGMSSALFEKIQPYITVYSDSGKINLNSARKDVLRAIYPDFTDNDIKRINQYKEENGPFNNVGGFVQFVINELGHSGFQIKYNDPNQYPFDVGTRSFMIESIGFIERSKSQITKMIKAGVGLVRSSQLKPLPGINTKAECDKQGSTYFFDRNTARCIAVPTERSQCENPQVFPGARWIAYENQNCCKLPGQATPICQVTGPQSTGTAGAPQKEPDPNALQIFYWTEA